MEFEKKTRNEKVKTIEFKKKQEEEKLKYGKKKGRPWAELLSNCP